MEDLNQAPIQLTDASEADFDPVWSPNGREIAFVSTRAGEDDIWIAHLDKIDNRFTNISNSPATSDQYPTWSPDGAYILWSSDSNGYPILQKMSYSSAAQSIRPYSEGSFPLWVGDQIYYLQLEANSNYLTSKSAENNSIGLPSLLIPGQVNGFSVLKITDSNIKTISGLAGAIERVLAVSDVPAGKINSSGKVSLQELDNVQAPYPYLLDLVSDSFGQLREKTANETGWDFLNTLERAFTPITDPANPGNEQDWCLTGRAFEFNPLTMYADLAVIVREERSGQIYWRVYLKTRYQDGSQGAPLTQLPWLLDTRYSDDPSTYETGGNRTGLPEGYWVDFTALALSMGWERQPALTNWKTYFSSAKFNQFVLKDGLDWFTAMNQVYPIEALQSPTPLLTATITPSITPTIRYYRSVTPTFAPTTTEIPTRRPTWTPSP
jgi:TolB protein